MQNKEYNYIMCGDCLQLIKQLPDKKVDVSFTSPPYNDSGNANEDINKNNTHRKYLQVETRKDWLEWQIEIIDEMLRVSKKYVLYNVQALSNNRKNIYKLIGHYADRIHDIIVWYKPNGCPTSTPNKISNKYEFLLILKCDDVKGVSVNSKFYTNVIVQNINSDKEFSEVHKAVMSKNFCEEIIREFTQENDIVLDPFSGTGTTAVCCKELDRKYIGFEIDENYYKLSLDRLNGISFQDRKKLDNGFQSIFDFME